MRSADRAFPVFEGISRDQRASARALALGPGQGRFRALFGVALEVLETDIHPAAPVRARRLSAVTHYRIVMGETAVVGDDMWIPAKCYAGRHRGRIRRPTSKVRRGVLIGAGAKIAGNIEIVSARGHGRLGRPAKHAAQRHGRRRARPGHWRRRLAEPARDMRSAVERFLLMNSFNL